MNRDVLARSDVVDLGRFLLTDLEAVQEFSSDPEVVQFMTWGPNSVADTHRYLSTSVVPDPLALHLVVLRHDVAVGTASVWTTDSQQRTGELGYVIARPLWGRGYATEVARMLLTLGADLLGLERIAATCDTENAASRRVLEKAGMEEAVYCFSGSLSASEGEHRVDGVG